MLNMAKLRLIFERQWLHALSLAILMVLVAGAADVASVRVGELWGVGSATWLWAGVAVAIAHQVFVWLCWRLQLHGSLLTRALGDRAFTAYAAIFALLGLSRIPAVVALAIANRDTLTVFLGRPFGATTPVVLKLLALAFAVPAGYLFYSVRRYFTYRRALGIDHFDDAYRSLPKVKQGIFRYTDNGMYFFGFLVLWVPGLWFASAGALFLALFSHLYIWVHFYATERPDMKRIYGG